MPKRKPLLLDEALEIVESMSDEEKAKLHNFALAMCITRYPIAAVKYGALPAEPADEAPEPRSGGGDEEKVVDGDPDAPEPQGVMDAEGGTPQKETEPDPEAKPVEYFFDDSDDHRLDLLKKAGLTTKGDVRQYREKNGSLTEIKGIGKTTDKEIVELMEL